jgi:hypothetical protein
MQVSTEKPDVDGKSMNALSTLGRDEDMVTNRLWQGGTSIIILEGVGDGMIPWCGLKLRIPTLCIYNSELFKSTIEKFLLEKVVKAMTEALPTDTRWYRTNAQLMCREPDDEATRAKEAAAAAAAAKAKAKALPKAAPTPKAAALPAGPEGKKGGKKRSSSSSGGSGSASASSGSSNGSKKSRKEDKKHKKKKD